MQHLDEGIIHAWLDGALAPDEAARAEAHVKDCPQCRAAVAEARGFIAASSRILTALDNVPRGVIPVAARKNRVQPWMLRVAATVLVLAGATALVLEQRGSKSYSSAAARLEAVQSKSDSSVKQVETTEGAAAANAVADQAAPPAVAAPTTAPVIRAQSPSALSRTMKAAPKTSVAEQNAAAQIAERRVSTLDGRVAGVAAADAEKGGAISPPVAPSPTRVAALGARGFALTPTPREVERKRMLGKTQTFYEIAPGDTVMLEEQIHVQLNEIVVTGAATSPAAADRRAEAQGARLTGKAAVPAAAPSETRQKTEAVKAAAAAPPPPPPVVLQDAPTGDTHRISWLDPETGSVLILSGRHSQEDLQRIREQIQKLRDAASAQSKKNPE
ncbi:MAG TPA: zf-HC2 domain-containing protein [Gemmatimonadaceae bacterium]|nr:zf-HC2 domain-containing protein [Gemmatimonadaceae bacterium]